MKENGGPAFPQNDATVNRINNLEMDNLNKVDERIREKLLKEGVMEKNEKAVLVTTEFRGVFYGRVKDDKNLPNEITLTNARNCIYWSADCCGFLGLASNGPTEKCKIGAMVPELKLYKITSVTPVSGVASSLWEGWTK